MITPFALFSSSFSSSWKSSNILSNCIHHRTMQCNVEIPIDYFGFFPFFQTFETNNFWIQLFAFYNNYYSFEPKWMCWHIAQPLTTISQLLQDCKVLITNFTKRTENLNLFSSFCLEFIHSTEHSKSWLQLLFTNIFVELIIMIQKLNAIPILLFAHWSKIN